MTAISATRHSRERTKERVGLSKTAADALAEKAAQEGFGQDRAKGSIRRYLDMLGATHRSRPIVYNRNVYIFRGTTLITVLNLPQRYAKIADKIQKGGPK